MRSCNADRRRPSSSCSAVFYSSRFAAPAAAFSCCCGLEQVEGLQLRRSLDQPIKAERSFRVLWCRGRRGDVPGLASPEGRSPTCLVDHHLRRANYQQRLSGRASLRCTQRHRKLMRTAKVARLRFARLHRMKAKVPRFQRCGSCCAITTFSTRRH